MTFTTEERVIGCLKGIATGDAVGKQTETLSQDDVVRWYPNGVRGFEGEPGSVIPRYIGNAKHEWRIGETTDDTERTIAVSRAILKEGSVTHSGVGREMLSCTKSVHPGVRSLWEFHQAGDPNRVAQGHDGCGAAIRVAPVGVLYSSGKLDEIVTGAREASISTHAGPLAIAAAAATAAAVSAAIDGALGARVREFAERAAVLAEEQSSDSRKPLFASAMREIHDFLRDQPSPEPAELAGRFLPDRPLTIVPLALALGTVMHSATEAILLATNVGGDTDSVASIAGGILGARYPDTVSDEWYAVVEFVNSLDVRPTAEDLSRLRN